MVDISKYAVTTGTVGLYIVIILAVFLIFALLAWWLYRLIKYNKRVVVRTVTGNNVLVEVDWAKEYKDKKTGAYYWRLKKRKHRIPQPPALALDITNKGKQWVEMYYVGQGQYVPCKTEQPDFAQKKEFVATFQPITESQRQTYADQVEKALAFKTKGWSELLTQAMPYITLVLILSVFLLFFNDGTKPIIEMANLANKASADLKEYALINERIVDKLETCGGTVVGGRPTPGNFTPPD